MTQASLFDIQKGRELRDAGMSRAIAHADRKEEGWGDRAYAVFMKFLDITPGPFLAEDVMAYGRTLELTEPPNRKAWGPVMLKASKAGRIHRVGFGSVKTPSAHCGFASIWEKKS
jgi:hypothetical protein